MADKKKPADWAEDKGVDAAILAACTVGNRWHRNPGLELSEEDFDAAVKAVDEIQVGGLHIEPEPEPKPKGPESKSKKSEVA